MKFRIVKQDRLDGSTTFQPQRKRGLWYFWTNLDSDGDPEDMWETNVNTMDRAVAIIEKAKAKYKRRTIKCTTIIPM